MSGWRKRREFLREGAVAGAAAVVAACRTAAPAGGATTPQPPVSPGPTPPAGATGGSFDHDAIVVGSGFGGAVTACRLAEGGYKVLVLERGRRWQVDENWEGPDDYLWSEDDPVAHNGWLDFRDLGSGLSTVAGAGVGGGSLHYANVSIDAPPDAFDSGWPPEITHPNLAPYYAKAKEMLRGRPIPRQQMPYHSELLRQGAEAIGNGSQFRYVDVAVNFKEDYEWDSSKVPNAADTVMAPNPEGVMQGTCVQLGNCVIGCKVRARNTLDTNYLARAEKNGAEVRPLHVVRKIAAEGGGYRVHYEEIRDGRLVKGSQSSRLVVVSAGSVASSELLLRCRDDHDTLKNLGPAVGTKFATNTNYLTIARHPGKEVFPTRGVTIGGAVGYFGAQKHNGQAVNIEDGGLSDLARAVIARSAKAGNLFAQLMKDALRLDEGFKNSMFWFSQGRDASVGRFTLKKRFLFFGSRRLRIDWDWRGADATVKAIRDIQERMARATGGIPPLSTWDVLHSSLTPHPLGGCPMGSSIQEGVVNHSGETFGYRNLFVVDGSIIPRAIGLNPTKTITALAERAAEAIVRAGR